MMTVTEADMDIMRSLIQTEASDMKSINEWFLTGLL